MDSLLPVCFLLYYIKTGSSYVSDPTTSLLKRLAVAPAHVNKLLYDKVLVCLSTPSSQATACFTTCSLVILDKLPGSKGIAAQDRAGVGVLSFPPLNSSVSA